MSCLNKVNHIKVFKSTQITEGAFKKWSMATLYVFCVFFLLVSALFWSAIEEILFKNLKF